MFQTPKHVEIHLLVQLVPDPVMVTAPVAVESPPAVVQLFAATQSRLFHVTPVVVQAAPVDVPSTQLFVSRNTCQLRVAVFDVFIYRSRSPRLTLASRGIRLMSHFSSMR